MNWLDIALGLAFKDLISLAATGCLLVVFCVVGYTLERVAESNQKGRPKR